MPKNLQIQNRLWGGEALEAEWRRPRQIARRAIREAVLNALFMWCAGLDEQLRDIRQGMARLRDMGAGTSSELERKDVDMLRATFVAVKDAMDDGWPVERAVVTVVSPIKVQWELC